MKKLVFVVLALISSPTLATDFDALAFERLNYDLANASDSSAKLDSILGYFDSLNRLGTGPMSTRKCLVLALSGRGTSECKSVNLLARSGGAGTGGAD